MFKRHISTVAALALVPQLVLAQAAEPTTTDGKIDAVKGQVDDLAAQLAKTKTSLESLLRLKISGYVQGRYGVQESTDVSKSATANDGFYIRRGRLKLVYDAGLADAVLQIDATSSGVSLKQAEAVLKIPQIGGYVLVGQTEYPFGYEVQASSADLALLERSRVVQAFMPGEYDRGLKAYARRGPVNVKLGVFNGNSTQYAGYTFLGRSIDVKPAGLDNDNARDVIGRVGVDLGILNAGVSGWWGQTYVTAQAVSGTAVAIPAGYHDRTRLGFDAQMKLDVVPVGASSLKGEFIAGKNPMPGGRDQIDVSSHGWYVQAQQFLGKKLELVARYDSYDPRNGQDNVASPTGRYASGNSTLNKTDTIGYGFHYYVSPALKFSAVHEIPLTKEPVALASNALGGNENPHDQALTLQLQARF